MFIILALILFMIPATYSMDCNKKYSFGAYISAIHQEPIGEIAHKNSNKEISELAELSKKTLLYDPQLINILLLRIPLEDWQQNTIFSYDFCFDNNQSKILILSHWKNHPDKIIKNQLTIFSTEDKKPIFNDFFYNGPITMRTFNFSRKKIAFTVDRDPFLFITTIDFSNMSKINCDKIDQYFLAGDFCNFSTIGTVLFDKEAKNIAIRLLNQEKNIAESFKELERSPENETIDQLKKRLEESIQWGDCIVIQL